MHCLFPCICSPRKSPQVKRVLDQMVRERKAEEALRTLTARLRGQRLRRAA